MEESMHSFLVLTLFVAVTLQWTSTCVAAADGSQGSRDNAELHVGPADAHEYKRFLAQDSDLSDMEEGKEKRSYLVDLGKRSYYPADLGKRSSKRFRADLGKRAAEEPDALGTDLEEGFLEPEQSKRYKFDLGKRFNFDLGKRYNFDLGKRYKFDLGKRYKYDMGKRASNDEDDNGGLSSKRYSAFKADLGKRTMDGDEKRFRFDLGKRDSFRADMGKRSDDAGYLEDLLSSENDQDFGSDDKRSAFKADLGKRSPWGLYDIGGFGRSYQKRPMMYRTDMGKRYNFDLGKRSAYDWKRLYRTDMGR